MSNLFKFYLPILIILSLIVEGVIFYSSRPKIGKDEAVLILNDGTKKRAFAGKVIDGMTIYDALLASSFVGKFDFELKEGVLERIDELEKDGKKWNVYLNGKKIDQPLDKVLIKPGDKIELKFK